jgi:hypothetical protein
MKRANVNQIELKTKLLIHEKELFTNVDFDYDLANVDFKQFVMK